VRDVEPPRSWRDRLFHYRSMWSGRHGRLELELVNGKRIRFATVDAGTNLRLVRGTVNRVLSTLLPENSGAPRVEPLVTPVSPSAASSPAPAAQAAATSE
jgi:hypothetical protein